MNSKDSLGNRMKDYEQASRTSLTGRMPMIIRLDGKAFHTLTRKLDKPYDVGFKEIMKQTTQYLVKNIMGCKLGYVQSDEISLLLTDYDKLETCAWFDKQVQKIVSVSASMATAYFNKVYKEFIDPKKIVSEFGMFDSRAFVLPKEEVCNYFIWRQQDATRNSIQGLGQANFSHKQLHGKSCDAIQDMLMLEKQINWNDVDVYFKRGGCCLRDVNGDIVFDENTPVFTKDREYIERHVNADSLDRDKLAYRNSASEILEGVPANDASIEKIGNIVFELKEIINNETVGD